MSDSVDRVLSHALKTVNLLGKTAKPPVQETLLLFGLCKQSNEGNVKEFMDRQGSRWHSEQEKREAKRGYITTLIEVAHHIASPNQEAQDLIAELEYVRDQANNAPSSPIPTSSSEAYWFSNGQDENENFEIDPMHRTPSGPKLRVLSPRGMREEQLVSNFNLDNQESGDDENDEKYYEARNTLDSEQTSQINHDGKDSSDRLGDRRSLVADREWRQRVGNSLNQINTKLAALQEQIEELHARRHRQRQSFLNWIRILGWRMLKHLIWDLLALLCLLRWMRLRGDRRLEWWIRAGWIRMKLKVNALLS